MSGFAELEPAAQAERLAALARQALARWGIGAQAIELLKYRENAVFRVVTADGRAFALRIHRAGYHSDAELRSELQWMQALLADGFDVPVLVPSRAGQLFEIVEHPAVPGARQVDLFEWIEGRQLGSVESGMVIDAAALARTFRTIGTLAARLHNQSAAWRQPPGFVRHSWDLEGLLGEQPFWGRFWELAALSPTQRQLIDRARAAMRTDLARVPRTPANYGLIHADFCPENLLVDGERVRLLDFDDAGFGWHLFEIVTSLYFYRREAYFADIEAQLLAGYRAHRPLPAEEVARLPLFYGLRGFTYLGWAHTRQETQTARELTPTLIELACEAAEAYFAKG
jgi:Ser/Thr protein kinase RdoA (MazF antagonist)